MAIYSARFLPEKQARVIKLTGIWVTLIATILLSVDVELKNHYNLWISRRGLFSNLLEAGFIGPIVLLVQVWSPWTSVFKTISQISGETYTLRISDDAIALKTPFTERRLATSEILRAEEPNWGFGLYLRTANRYRWQLIPKTLDGYPQVKNEIQSLGIPVVRTAIPPNWEEFVGVLTFCASLIVDMLNASRSLLIANLAVALLLGIGGSYVMNANPDNGKMRKMGRIGVWIPAVFSALAVFFAS